MKGDVMKKLLIVEDDNDLREGLEFTFRSEKYEVISANTIKKNKRMFTANGFSGNYIGLQSPRWEWI